MSASNTIFSGTSRYSNDFRQIIDRSVAIASLQLLQMRSQRTALNDQSTALSALNTRFASIRSAVNGLEQALGAGSYSVSNSDGAVVKAGLAGGAMEGTYSVEVLGIGSYTSAMSRNDLPKVADSSAASISSATSFTLDVGGVEHTLTPAANTLSALAEAVNASGAAAEATLVNIGSSSSPDYRLSIRSTLLGEVSVQLHDGSGDLLGTLSTGTLATYQVNGQPETAVESDTRTVTIAPGLTATLLKAGTANLTVARSADGVSNALSSFAAAYNAGRDELNLHRGENAGALKGNSILQTLSRTVREVAGYSNGAGGLSSLTVLGLGFTEEGKLTFDAAAFTTAATGRMSELENFVAGFQQFAAAALDGLLDATGGAVPAAIQAMNTQIANQETRIAAEQSRIDRLEERLMAQMAAADALIASLERQVHYMTGLFEAMRIARERFR